MLMLHNEVNSIATFSATKAFENSACRRDIERRSFFVVKRTQTYHTGTATFQRHKITYYLVNAGGIHDYVNSFFFDHGFGRWKRVTNLPKIRVGVRLDNIC